MFTLPMIQMLDQEMLLKISNLRIAYYGATNIVKNTDKHCTKNEVFH